VAMVRSERFCKRRCCLNERMKGASASWPMTIDGKQVRGLPPVHGRPEAVCWACQDLNLGQPGACLLSGPRPQQINVSAGESVWWACQDLNLGPHPERKIARISTINGLCRTKESRARPGRPILIPRGGPRPWGSYQLNAGNRCADGRFRRSRATVGAKVMRSIGAQVCVLLWRSDAR
jgi:hypothetical protein